MWSRVSEAAEKLGRLNLVHDDQAAQSLLDIRRKAVHVKRQHGLDVLFVDFLQLMQGAGEDNRNRELDVISNGLKALAMDLQIGVVVLSQMSRKADETFHAPVMTYLRDSGAIEAAADQIALLFTDHAHPLSPKMDNFAGFSKLEIVAHRNGGTGVVPLRFEGMYQQISDWGSAIPTRTASKQSSRGMD
jgi:replicative DNA helicase